MRSNTSDIIEKNIKKVSLYKIELITFCMLLFAAAACKKADNFYDKESQYPQVSNAAIAAYKPAYVVGDTMLIVGRLQPKNNLQISIGGVNAQIVQTDSVRVKNETFEDRVGVLITTPMIGQAREVKISSGGYSTLGAAIDVYSTGGEGSFNTSLKTVQLTTLSSAYQFLYAVTGKGDVYYFNKNTTQLMHIRKDGSGELIRDLSPLHLTAFLAGGVDPQEQNLYFSVQLASGFAFYKLSLQTQALTILNQSAGFSAPYDGNINTAHLLVTAIYPDSKGNIYLGMGRGNLQASPNFVPDGLARYSVADNGIHYIFRQIVNGGANANSDMPGTSIPSTVAVESIRINPDEDLLYTIGRARSLGINEINLSVGILTSDLEPTNATNDLSNFNVIAPFSGLAINLGVGIVADQAFGFLPMPHRRLQSLIFQYIDNGRYFDELGNAAAKLNFPKWIVFDFQNSRTYAYAPNLFQTNDGAYAFNDTDELLNYDEEGNLYSTANNKSYLIQTQPAN